MTQYSLKRLRNRLADVTLSISLQDYQRKAILNVFDEWAVRELGREMAKAVKKGHT